MHGVPTDVLHIAETNIGINSAKTDRLELLRLQEHTIKKKLRTAVESKAHDLEKRRLNFQKRAKRSMLIAIIGYTNAGKTSLIKRYVINFSIKLVLAF
jgi:50S ribosomal subunit-associated GTPase HflX